MLDASLHDAVHIRKPDIYRTWHPLLCKGPQKHIASAARPAVPPPPYGAVSSRSFANLHTVQSDAESCGISNHNVTAIRL